MTATTPETGPICYGTKSGSTCNENYDANGNLLSKVDNKGITTNYSNDYLNRQTGKSYTDGVTAQVTMT